MTPREDEVLTMILAGRSRTEIALAMTLDTSTVERTLHRLRQRHYVPTTTALVAKVLRDRLDAAQRELALCRIEHDQCKRDLAALDRRRHGPGRMVDA